MVLHPSLSCGQSTPSASAESSKKSSNSSCFSSFSNILGQLKLHKALLLELTRMSMDRFWPSQGQHRRPLLRQEYSQCFQYDNPSFGHKLYNAVTSQLPDRLCERCQSLDWEVIMQRENTDAGGSFVMNIELTPKELKVSDCALCRVLGSMFPLDFDDDGLKREGLCHVRAFSANRLFTGFLLDWEANEICDTNVLAVIRMDISKVAERLSQNWLSMLSSMQETGCLCPVQQQNQEPPPVLDVRPVSRESWDVKFVKSCIAYCAAHHGKVCNETIAPFPEALRVIDCETRTVVTATTDCQYVALSYVWGQSESDLPTIAIDNAPKLIDDSIEVTLRLNLRYLWVDKYCINQADELDKHNQIRQMDLVYACAYLTIIAAAGSGPHYGLPGVRGTLRSAQPHIKIGNYIFASSLPAAKLVIKNSTWATRGWTYQEGVFSNRRLFFTNHQVFYECNEMQGMESMALPLDAMHEKGEVLFHDNVPGHRYFNSIPGKQPGDFMGYVSEFNQRELRYPGDVFNAMYGIFNSFSRHQNPVHHLVGVEIPPVKHISSLNYEAPYTRSAEESFVVGLSWCHLAPSTQRTLFPSWTWAGWHGRLSYGFIVYETSPTLLKNVKVCIEEPDGSLVRFPDWDNLSDFLAVQMLSTKFIHLEANTLAFPLVFLQKAIVLSECEPSLRKSLERHAIQRDGHFAEFKLDEETIWYFQVWLDKIIDNVEHAREAFTGKTSPLCFGIALDGSTINSSNSNHRLRTILLVQERNSYHERVGIFSLGMLYGLQRINGKWNTGISIPNTDISSRISDLPWTRRTIRLG